MYVGRTYPGGLDVVRRRAKPQFIAGKEVTVRYWLKFKDPAEIENGIKKVEWIISELEAISAFHKYR